MHRAPHKAMRDLLVIVPVDVAGAGHLAPGDSRMTRLHFGRQAARGFRDDLEAARDCVKRPRIRQEAFVVEPSAKEIARSMLKSISDRLSRSDSESIDRVGGSLGEDTLFQAFAADDIDGTIEHLGDKLFHAGIIENRNNDCRIKIDQDVDVAVGPVVTARDGAKQRGMGNALRPQVGLSLLELLYDLIAFHSMFCSTKAADLAAKSECWMTGLENLPYARTF